MPDRYWAIRPDGQVEIGAVRERQRSADPDGDPGATASRTLVQVGSRCSHRDTVYPVIMGGVAATEAPATVRAYRSDWLHFSAWCQRNNQSAFPAAPWLIASYLAAHADTLKVSTLSRRISSIAAAHRSAGYPFDTTHPDLRWVWKGIRRERGTAQRRVEPLTPSHLKEVLATCGERLIDLRDRALLLMGFSAALRRSELCALDVADVVVSAEGLALRLARSKGDLEGTGVIMAIGRTGQAACPAAAYNEWIAMAGIVDGRVFRSVDRHGRTGAGLSTRAVALIIKARVAAAGLDATAYSSHSMRSGFATAAAAAGVS